LIGHADRRAGGALCATIASLIALDAASAALPVDGCGGRSLCGMMPILPTLLIVVACAPALALDVPPIALVALIAARDGMIGRRDSCAAPCVAGCLVAIAFDGIDHLCLAR